MIGWFGIGGNGFAADVQCQKLDVATFTARSPEWRGRELVAFASWCSSCKPKILAAADHPEKYVLLAAFDDAQSTEKVLRKLKISAPCFYGEELVEHLGISMLPWSKKI